MPGWSAGTAVGGKPSANVGAAGPSSRQDRGVLLQDCRAPPSHTVVVREVEVSVIPPRRKPAYVSMIIVIACVIVFIFEIRANGWSFQPLWCSPGACEPNLMIGPTAAVLNAMGGKNDALMFAPPPHNQWWRLATCNWLHAGIIHLVFNMLPLFCVGRDLEHILGPLAFSFLYVVAGLFGAAVSVVFLPNSISVGASASIFGLMGACWADLLVTFCAECQRGESQCARDECGCCRLCCRLGCCVLLQDTVINLLIGLTPWVDQYMHVGGLVFGLAAGVGLFHRRRRLDAERQRSGTTPSWRQLCATGTVEGVSLLVVIVMLVTVYSVMTSSATRASFRTCSACFHFNCVPTPWWTCDAMAVSW